MILPDTSVWVEHFKASHGRLGEALRAHRVVLHEFVQGELVCGGVGPGTEHWVLLQTLRRAPVVSHEEVVELFVSRRLHRSGIGWIDSHLLASAMIGGHKIITLDRPLSRAAAMLGCGA